MQFDCIESRYLGYIVATKCYVKIKWQSKRVLSVTLFTFVSVYISILYQYMYFFIVLYIDEKHLTTIVKNILLNTSYSKNTPIFLHIILSHFIANTNPLLEYCMDSY